MAYRAGTARSDFGGLEELFEAVVGGVLRERDGEGASQGDEGVEGGGLVGGHFVAGGDLLDLDVQRARQRQGRGGAGDDGGVGLEGQREAEDLDGAAFR